MPPISLTTKGQRGLSKPIAAIVWKLPEGQIFYTIDFAREEKPKIKNSWKSNDHTADISSCVLQLLRPSSHATVGLGEASRPEAENVAPH